MPIIINKKLYDSVKREADHIYTKPSAYKSMWIVKTYKDKGGTYKNDNQPKNLDRWMRERWVDIGKKEYPVFRPTRKVSKKTPLLASEIQPINLKEQINLKQIIQGRFNLPKFKKKKYY